MLDNHLGAEVSAGVITTKQDALDYLTWTFFFRRLHKNPTYYGLEISAEEHKDSPIVAQQLAADYMVKLVDKSLNDLAESDCVFVHSNGDVDSTPFGKIMSYYYLSHLTIRSMLGRSRKTPAASFADVLAWVSLATEFDDLPVRHNEDLINAELAKNLPLDTLGLLDGMPMWDPHVKAFLLLQAHMSRIDLPISDYVGDQTSVLDQTIRIAQAGVDLMTEMGRFGAVKEMVHLLQGIKSARWPRTDYPLSVLPGVYEVFDERLEGKVPKDLVTTVSLAHHQNSKAVLDGLMNNFGIKNRGQFVKTVNTLPDVHLTASGQLSSGVSVTINRKNALQDREGRIYAPKFPKPQTEGYFVLVSPAGGNGDNILALKRANWPSNQGLGSRPKLSSTVQMKIEPMEQVQKVDVLVMSDAYPGMEWTLKGIEVPAMEKETVKTVQVHIDGGFKEGKGKLNAGGSEDTHA